jgi:CPA1 family monovalent cation:H+ antiporter
MQPFGSSVHALFASAAVKVTVASGGYRGNRPTIVTEESAFILLFVVATGVALAVRVVRVPYTVALVLAGLAIGALQLFPAPVLTKELLFSVFLPGLIFEAAFHLDGRQFRDNWVMIAALAVLGVVASIALIALALPPIVHAFGMAPGFSWRHALVFGALISATDPVAVVGLFRYMRAPPRLATLLAGESLLNDGTAIVFFTLSLGIVEGADSGAAELTAQFLSVVGMGAMIGIVIGAAGAWLIRRVADPMIEIAVTTSVAYGSFVAAQTLNASGVIATVAGGMLCAGYGARTGMSATTKAACGSFWEYVAFALNSIVFLLIGFEVQLPLLISSWLPILVAYVVVTVGRGVVIAVNHTLADLTPKRMPSGWSLVLAWGGLRGALPMVLVLTLPTTFPYRQLLVSMTFGVAVLSILLQGLTMRWLMTRLKVIYQPARNNP